MLSKEKDEKRPSRKPLYFLTSSRTPDEIENDLKSLVKDNKFDVTYDKDKENLADFILVDLDNKPKGWMNYINGKQSPVFVNNQFVVFFSLNNECGPQTISDICDAYNCEPEIHKDPDQLKKNICWLRAMSPFHKERRKEKRSLKLEDLVGLIKLRDSL